MGINWSEVITNVVAGCGVSLLGVVVHAIRSIYLRLVALEDEMAAIKDHLRRHEKGEKPRPWRN